MLTANKLLKGLIKVVHPDRYVTANKNIRETNLSCVQVLNEILDFSNTIDVSIKTHNKIDVKIPLKKKYETMCYLHINKSHMMFPVDNCDDDNSLYRKSKFILIPPPEFLIKQNIIEPKQVQRLITHMTHNIMESYIHLNVKSSLVTITKDDLHKYSKYADNVAGIDGRRRDEEYVLHKKDQDKFYDIAYQRWLKLEIEEKRRVERVNKYRRELQNIKEQFEEEEDVTFEYNKPFNQSRSSRVNAMNSKGRKNKKRSYNGITDSKNQMRSNSNRSNLNAMLSVYVDQYLTNGNIIFKHEIYGNQENMDRIQHSASNLIKNDLSYVQYTQNDIVEKIRGFLIEYGSTIHFHVDDYQNVLFCVYNLFEELQNQDYHSKATESDENIKILHEATRAVPFNCVQYDSYYIIDILYTYKSKLLCRFIQDHLPQANILSYSQHML